MRRGPEAGLRGRGRAVRPAARRAAAPASGASGHIRRSGVQARVPLLALAPGSPQVVLRDGRHVHVIVRAALDVDGIDVLILELVLGGLGLTALDVVVEATIGLRLGAARLDRRACLVDVDVGAGIGQRGTNALAVAVAVGADSHGLDGHSVRVVLDVGSVFDRLLTILSAATDVIGALLRERLVGGQTAVARSPERGVRAPAAAREDGGTAPVRDLFLVAALRLFLRELGLRADVDTPAGKAGRQTGVQAFATDRQRQLVVRNHDRRLLRLVVDQDLTNPGGRQRLRDEARRLLVERDDV